MDKIEDGARALDIEDGARALEKKAVISESKQLEGLSINELERRIDHWFNKNYFGNDSCDDAASIKNSKFMESLQCLCSKRGISQPKYELNSQEGPPHLIKFTYECSVDDKVVRATALSKTLCKHLAAQKMLKLLESSTTVTFPKSEKDSKLIKNQDHELKTEASNAFAQPVILLQAHCSRNKLPLPDYTLIKEEGPPHLKSFTFECKVGRFVEVATSSSKTRAKHLAANKLLDNLESEQYCCDEFQSKLSLSNSDLANSDSSKAIVLKMSIERLNKVCLDNHGNFPNYIIKNVGGPPHNRSFTCECSVGDIVVSATAQSKSMSKHLAAEKMLKNIKLPVVERSLQTDYTVEINDDNPITRHGPEFVKSLHQWCSLKKLSQPIFSLIKEEVFSDHRSFTYECKVENIVEVATDNNKKKAKCRSAEMVLEKLFSSGLLNTPGTVKPKEESPTQVLIRFCADNLFSLPIYNDIGESVEGCLKQFIFSCQVDDLIEIGTASSKKDAKHSASSKVLQKLKSGSDFEEEDYKVSCNMDILDFFADIQLKKK